VAVTDLLRHDPSPTEATVREALTGNLCRCTGYQKILEAVFLAAGQRRLESRVALQAEAAYRRLVKDRGAGRRTEAAPVIART